MKEINQFLERCVLPGPSCSRETFKLPVERDPAIDKCRLRMDKPSADRAQVKFS